MHGWTPRNDWLLRGEPCQAYCDRDPPMLCTGGVAIPYFVVYRGNQIMNRRLHIGDCRVAAPLAPLLAMTGTCEGCPFKTSCYRESVPIIEGRTWRSPAYTTQLAASFFISSIIPGGNWISRFSTESLPEMRRGRRRSRVFTRWSTLLVRRSICLSMSAAIS